VTHLAAEDAATDQDESRTTRRALLGLGVVGATLAASRSVSAAPAADVAAFAIAAELTAAELYALADGDLWDVMSQSHGAFAERLAGISGVSADLINDEVYDAFADVFASSDPSPAALTLENTLAATHSDLMGLVEDDTMLAAIASIVASESRHAAVIAQLSDAGLDAALVNDAASIAPEA
jgi:hypothetical protein